MKGRSCGHAVRLATLAVAWMALLGLVDPGTAVHARPPRRPPPTPAPATPSEPTPEQKPMSGVDWDKLIKQGDQAAATNPEFARATYTRVRDYLAGMTQPSDEERRTLWIACQKLGDVDRTRLLYGEVGEELRSQWKTEYDRMLGAYGPLQVSLGGQAAHDVNLEVVSVKLEPQSGTSASAPPGLWLRQDFERKLIEDLNAARVQRGSASLPRGSYRLTVDLAPNTSGLDYQSASVTMTLSIRSFAELESEFAASAQPGSDDAAGPVLDFRKRGRAWPAGLLAALAVLLSPLAL